MDTFLVSDISEDIQQDVIVAFNNTSRNLDDIFNIDNSYCDQIVSNIYPNELQFNKTNSGKFSTSVLYYVINFVPCCFLFF
jgi:hypothetical protein